MRKELGPGWLPGNPGRPPPAQDPISLSQRSQGPGLVESPRLYRSLVKVLVPGDEVRTPVQN